MSRQEKQPWRLYESSYGRKLLKTSNKSYKCVRCGARKNPTADHILPLNKGGTTILPNLQWLCKRCHEIKTKEDKK